MTKELTYVERMKKNGKKSYDLVVLRFRNLIYNSQGENIRGKTPKGKLLEDKV